LYSQKEKEGEERKIRRLQFLVDFTCALLYQEHLTLEEGYRLVAGVKRFALQLFPDKEETFDMIYGARFHRILSERFLLL
jgi:hypothetical protein